MPGSPRGCRRRSCRPACSAASPWIVPPGCRGRCRAAAAAASSPAQGHPSKWVGALSALAVMLQTMCTAAIAVVLARPLTRRSATCTYASGSRYGGFHGRGALSRHPLVQPCNMRRTGAAIGKGLSNGSRGAPPWPGGPRCSPTRPRCAGGWGPPSRRRPRRRAPGCPAGGTPPAATPGGGARDARWVGLSTAVPKRLISRRVCAGQVSADWDAQAAEQQARHRHACTCHRAAMRIVLQAS